MTRPVPVVAALTVALIATWYLVLRSALFVDVLVLDELTLVPAVTGAETGLEHLLAPHHGHRLVLPRALQELTLWLSGNRLWTPRFLTLVAMLGSAALFLALARRLRGGPAPEDMVVPLALLRPDLAGAFTHAFDLQFALHTTLCALLVWLALLDDAGTRWRSPALLVVLVLLGLTGMNGLVAGAVLAPFLAAYAFDWHDPRARQRARWFAPLWVGVSWFSLGALSSWEAALHASGSATAKLRTVEQFLGTSLGPLGVRLSPAAGWVLAAGVLASLALPWLVPRATASEPRARSIIAGALLASLAVAAAVGWGRGGWGGSAEAAHAPRFVPLSVGLLAFTHLACVASGVRSPSWAMAALLAVSLPSSFVEARERARSLARVGAHLTDDVRRGLPIATTAERNEALFIYDRAKLGWFLSLLCEKRLGPYRTHGTGSCSTGSFEPRTLESGERGIELAEVSYAVLSRHDAGCGASTARSPGCHRAIRTFCRERGADTGFGPVESSESIANVVCVRGKRLPTTWAQLSRLDAACRLDGAPPGACERAAHMSCRERGELSGLLVQGPEPELTCFDTPAEQVFATQGELERMHASCFEPARAFGNDCAAAIHRYCRSRGRFSGFGPVALEAQRLTLICL